MFKKNSYKLYMNILLSLLFVLALVGCKKDDSNNNIPGGSTSQNIKGQFLTATVYNATISTLEDEEFNQEEYLDLPDNDHDFSYEKIQIMKGYSFNVTLDFNLEPFFENDVKGKEIEVIISLFQLYSGEYEAWYEQKMIIFKSETEIIGFLTGGMRIVDNMNPFPYEVDDLFFQSCHFLTSTEVVKYYEKGDIIYSIFADLSDPSNIKLEISSEQVFITDPKDLTTIVNSASFTEISGGEVIDIMELTKHERVDVKATIVSVDLENRLLYVSSDDAPTLETVEYYSSETIYDLEGNKLSFNDLKIGDIIKVYYYKRHNSYIPYNIRVDEIIVEKNIAANEQI